MDNKEKLSLIYRFAEVMGFEVTNSFIKANIRPAGVLLQDYSIDAIIEAVEFAKKMIAREKKFPQQYIPNLATVVKNIHVWRSLMRLNEKEIKEGKWV